jgi:hypothetical protein
MRKNFFYHLHVSSRKVVFRELPAIDHVSIEYEDMRLNAPEVIHYFCGVTAISAKVKVA